MDNNKERNDFISKFNVKIYILQENVSFNRNSKAQQMLPSVLPGLRFIFSIHITSRKNQQKLVAQTHNMALTKSLLILRYYIRIAYVV